MPVRLPRGFTGFSSNSLVKLRIDFCRPAVSLQGVGNRATCNLIDNAPHQAISFGGNEHLIEFNEIHSVCFESNDAGAIYSGRDWTMRGTVIRNNLLLLFGSQNYEGLRTREGKERLREAVLAEVRAIVKERAGRDGVTQVYFTHFVMQ